MFSLVSQTDIQSERPRLPHRTVVKYNLLFPNLKMGLKYYDDSLHFHPRKLSSAHGLQYGSISSVVTLFIYLLFTSSLTEASLRHSPSSLLNLIGLQQPVSSVASFASPVAAPLSTSSQSLHSATSFNAKLHNGKWQIAEKICFFL